MNIPSDILRKCWFLAGPTASGKSNLAIELAKQFPPESDSESDLQAEIISLDSMSLYRQMDTGTAKPSSQQRAEIPHHLIDLLDPHEEFSLAEYVTAAASACQKIVARNRIPLFVGGTGLYLRGILRGVFSGPAADWEFRNQLEADAQQNEPGYLHRLLTEVDPAAASSLHPNDVRRLIRALEVHHITGQPLSQQQQQQPLPPGERPQHVYWLSLPRDILYQRINERVDCMISQGLIDEVEQLLSADQPLSRTARQGLGYKEVIDHLEGQCSLDECITQIKTRTRQFAKRQHTWFRNLEECTPIEITGNESTSQLAQRLLDLQ